MVYNCSKSFNGTRIQSQILVLMEKSILYAKITVSDKKLLQNSVLNSIYLGPLFLIVTIMSHILVNT